MTDDAADFADFDLADFLPYLLNEAAEAAAAGFAAIYRSEYGMLRAEWRALFHLGRHGPMSAGQIGRHAHLHKTKVSRAVRALEAKRFLIRQTAESDRRVEILALSPAGQAAYHHLAREARRYDARLAETLSESEAATLRRCLARLAADPSLDSPPSDPTAGRP